MKIPVRISPAFFLTAGVIGFINSYSLFGTIIWIGIIFVSVLVHEYGHAIAARVFGQKASIELIAFGGLTIPEGPKLKLWKEFVMVFMGPFFGFMLVVLSSFILLLPIQNQLVRAILETFRFVNLFWTIINLFPILPLDGGQLLRIIMEGIFGAKAWRYALIVSLGFSAIFGFFAFVLGQLFIGVIFMIFAFQSFETLRRLTNYKEADQSFENRDHLKQVEMMMQRGEIAGAKNALEDLIRDTKSGMINVIARQYLAKILFEEGDHTQVYHLLRESEKYLSAEGKYILYMAAHNEGDHEMVVRLSGEAFQQFQSAEIAIYAASAHSILKDVSLSIQWLKTASSFEGINIQEVVRSAAFDTIRSDPAFVTFLKKISSK